MEAITEQTETVELEGVTTNTSKSRGRKLGQPTQKSLRKKRQAELARQRFSKNPLDAAKKRVTLLKGEGESVEIPAKKRAKSERIKAKTTTVVEQSTFEELPKDTPLVDQVQHLTATVHLLVDRLASAEKELKLVREDLNDTLARYDTVKETLSVLLDSRSAPPDVPPQSKSS